MTIDPTTSRLASQGVAYAPEIAGAARRHGIDPELLAAVAAQETGGPGSNAGHNEIGDGGHGHGVFQIDDRWHTFAQTPAAMDPAKNADYAAGMISGLLDRYGGNVHKALSAYNAGSPDAAGTTTQWPDGRRLGYADSVLQHYTQLTGRVAPEAVASLTGPAAAISAEPASAQESAIAELPSLISELGALQSQAMALPSPPSLPPVQQSQPYQQQPTDYGSLLADNADN